MSVRKDLGMVTAYAYAVSKGYAGTEEEFATLMASYADVGQAAVDAALAAKASEDAAKASETAAEASETAAATSAGTATTAAQTASQAAQIATTKASEATTAASTATTKAAEAAQSATAAAGSATTAGASATAAQAAQTAAETAQGKAEDAQAAAEAAAQTLVIDPTLTQPNQAAEAKATGDAISLVKSQLDAIDSRFESTFNLFNPDDPDLVENVELKTNGTTAAKTGFFASGYIPVRPGQTVCCHYPTGTYGSASTFVWYDENKQRTGYSVGTRLTDANGNGYIKYTFPADSTAKYFRLTGSMGGMRTFYMYVYADSMPSDYTPYVDYLRLSQDVKVTGENLLDVHLTADKTDFIKSNPTNLNDLSAMVTGIFVNTSNSGNMDTSVTNWRTTDFIPVEPGQQYSFYDNVGVYYGVGHNGYPLYDADKNFVTKIVPNGGKSASSKLDVLTIPQNNRIKYIRTCYPVANLTNHKLWWRTMIVKGTTYPGEMYIPYEGTVNLQGAGISKEFSAPFNCLSNKIAIWNGDSICAADNDPNGGWAMTIATAKRMAAKNYGIAGGTIAENTGATVHSVSGTLDTMLSEVPNADYIIIEGGTNDADILGDSGIGSFDAADFSAEYIANLNKDTFTGALESIFYRLVTQMKGKHIGYIIPQKMGHTEVLVTRRRVYFDRAIDVCKKWGIPYIDLWNDFYFNWRLTAHWNPEMTSDENNTANNLYRDGQHLTDFGYAVESPVIAEWMKTI